MILILILILIIKINLFINNLTVISLNYLAMG